LVTGSNGDSVVYLSAEFMVSVMKGLLLLDRQALQDYLMSVKDKRALFRTNRFNATGRVHMSLVPFLWPTTEASLGYWDWVRSQGQREAEVWPMDVVKALKGIGASKTLRGRWHYWRDLTFWCDSRMTTSCLFPVLCPPPEPKCLPKP
jgi:hypothetical protein